MPQKIIPLSAADIQILQSFRKQNRAEPALWIIVGILIFSAGLLAIFTLAPDKRDTGFLVFILVMQGIAVLLIRMGLRFRKQENPYAAVLKANKKHVSTGKLVQYELTASNTIRYQLEDGSIIEVYPLLTQIGPAGKSSFTRKLVAAEALLRVPVTLEVAPLQESTGFLLHLQYDNELAQMQEQPILAADRASVRKEMGMVALVFLIILFILFLIIGFTGNFSIPAILIGWVPPAVIIGIGLFVMVIKYYRSVKSATHKIVITGVVTEKITAWAPAGKRSARHTWYRIGTEAFESSNASLADPGQKIQVAFTARKDGLRGRFLSMGQDSPLFL